MDHTEIKEWLDRLVDNIIERKALKDFNNHIRTDAPDDILVYEGIEVIAEAVGATLTEEKWNSDEYPYRYRFVYRGIELNGYEAQRLESFKEAGEC